MLLWETAVIFRSCIFFTTTPVFAWRLSDVQWQHKLWQAQGEIPAPAARLSSACAIIATQLLNSALGGSLWYLACPCCCVWNGHREIWAVFIPQMKSSQHNKAPRAAAQCFAGSLILHQPILHPLWEWFCSDNQQAEEIYFKSLCYGGIVQAVKPKFMRPSHKTEDIYSAVAGAGLCFMISGGRQGSAPVPCVPFWLIPLWGSPASGERRGCSEFWHFHGSEQNPHCARQWLPTLDQHSSHMLGALIVWVRLKSLRSLKFSGHMWANVCRIPL